MLVVLSSPGGSALFLLVGQFSVHFCTFCRLSRSSGDIGVGSATSWLNQGCGNRPWINFSPKQLEIVFFIDPFLFGGSSAKIKKKCDIVVESRFRKPAADQLRPLFPKKLRIVSFFDPFLFGGGSA